MLITKNYNITYRSIISHSIEEKNFMIKTVIDKQLIEGNPIISFEIFKASIIFQLGKGFTTENIIDCYPPPVLFIEIWNFDKNDTREFEFDNFRIKVMDKDFEYVCVGALIHTDDHFKTVAFDFGHKILLDDAIVADLTSENEDINIFKEFELEELQENILMLVYQINQEQFDEYSSLENL